MPLWIVCEHFNLHFNFWSIDLLKKKNILQSALE